MHIVSFIVPWCDGRFRIFVVGMLFERLYCECLQQLMLQYSYIMTFNHRRPFERYAISHANNNHIITVMCILCACLCVFVCVA